MFVRIRCERLTLTTQEGWLGLQLHGQGRGRCGGRPGDTVQAGVRTAESLSYSYIYCLAAVLRQKCVAPARSRKVRHMRVTAADPAGASNLKELTDLCIIEL
jgi:hypothetical protein